MAAIALVLTGVITSQGAKAAPTDFLATGAGEGGAPHVRAFGPDGTASEVNFYARGTDSSGAFVGAGDINGDNVQDLVTASGPGGVATTVSVYRKDTTELATIVPFAGWSGGATVAAGNVDASDRQEVIVGSGPGMASTVKAFRLVNDQLEEVFSFAPYGTAFRGGVFVGAANGFIVTGAGAGGGPHVKVFKIAGGVPELFSEWMAYGSFPGGVRVALGQTQGPGKLNVVTGAGPGGGPHVRIFNIDGVSLHQFYAFGPTFPGGVWVGIAGQARTVVGAGAGGGPHVKAIQYNSDDGKYAEVASFYAYGSNFPGGVRVAGLEPSKLPCGTQEIPGLGCPDGSDETTTTVKPTTTTVAPSTTSTTAGTTTTTAASACDTVELPGLGCLPGPGGGETTTTTAAPTTTTSTTSVPVTSTSTSTSTPASTSTSTTVAVP